MSDAEMDKLRELLEKLLEETKEDEPYAVNFIAELESILEKI